MGQWEIPARLMRKYGQLRAKAHRKMLLLTFHSRRSVKRLAAKTSDAATHSLLRL